MRAYARTMRCACVLLALAPLIGACTAGDGASPRPTSGSPVATAPTAPGPSRTGGSPLPTAAPDGAVELVAVGDIARCSDEADDAVGMAVADEEADVVALLGDLVYPDGTPETYRDCFLPTWGALLERTRPAVGNHDLSADGGAAYWALFGERAGRPDEGWYSYEAGSWHVVVLNSNCQLVACTPGSPQHDWLVADLEATSARCVLAYWHHPMTASGTHGRYPPVDPLWSAAVEGGVDLVLTGHEHYYERLAPFGSNVAPDPDGVPLIVAGTGGAGLRPRQDVVAGSEVIIEDVHGYVRLSLAAGGYTFEFVDLDGEVRDRGSASCR